jgi:hypothetical protein
LPESTATTKSSSPCIRPNSSPPLRISLWSGTTLNCQAAVHQASQEKNERKNRGERTCPQVTLFLQTLTKQGLDQVSLPGGQDALTAVGLDGVRRLRRVCTSLHLSKSFHSNRSLIGINQTLKSLRCRQIADVIVHSNRLWNGNFECAGTTYRISCQCRFS